MDKAAIRKNFSRYAHLYDKYADVQKKAGRRLLKCIGGNKFAKILELGSGTGNYTQLLRKRFNHAEIMAVDISRRMIECARKKLEDRNIQFIHADAQNLNLRGRFDLITSNGCFQWFEELEGSLLAYRKQLKKNGIIAFTIFGPGTFYELNAALGCVLRGISTASREFITKNRLEDFLRKEFNEVEMREVKYREKFSNLAALLKKIKYSGVKGNSGIRINFNRRTLKNIEKVYLDKFKGIKATYQVFFCKVKK